MLVETERIRQTRLVVQGNAPANAPALFRLCLQHHLNTFSAGRRGVGSDRWKDRPARRRLRIEDL